MAEAEVAAFLSHITLDRNVAPNTQNQALNALNFLYTHVLGKTLQPITGIVRAKKSQKLPVVLDRQEIRALFREMDPPYWLLTGLMYGSGLRLMEGLRLRVKDIDFNYRAIVVKDGKGRKDRVVTLPDELMAPIKVQLEQAHVKPINAHSQSLPPARQQRSLRCAYQSIARLAYQRHGRL